MATASSSARANRGHNYLWLGSFILLLPALAKSQSTQVTPPDPLAAIPHQILDQRQAFVGAHTVIFNRLAPPIFPVYQAPAPALPTVSATKWSMTGTNPAAIETPKEYRLVFISSTVYDHQFTEVRFSGGTTIPALQAFVNLDFNCFDTVIKAETDDTSYLFLFDTGNDPISALSQERLTPPNLTVFPPGYSSYQIVGGDAANYAEDLAALDVLCAYYDANKASLNANDSPGTSQVYNTLRALGTGVAKPPVAPPDTVINFWPVKNSIYLGHSH